MKISNKINVDELRALSALRLFRTHQLRTDQIARKLHIPESEVARLLPIGRSIVDGDVLVKK